MPEALHGWVFVLAVEQLGLGLAAHVGHTAETGAAYGARLGWRGAVPAFVALRVALGRLVTRRRRRPGAGGCGTGQGGDGDEGDGRAAVGASAGRSG